MSRRRGSVQKRDGAWWARISYVGEDGKRHEKRRKATSKGKASELVRKLLHEADQTDGRILSHDSRSFDQLADLYEETYLVPVAFTPAGKKIRGMRPKSLQTARLQLKMLREAFAGHRVRAITYGHLEAFRSTRFQTATKPRLCQKCDGAGGKCKPCGGAGRIAGRRSHATVNRELTMLNTMLNFAKRQGWIVENPFQRGAALVKLRDETKRTRVLSDQEEARMLAAMPDTIEGRRLRAVFVIAVDSGMRQGEILALQWSDVDLQGRAIRVRAETTKTLSGRTIPVTARMRQALQDWQQSAGTTAGVFGYTGNLNRTYRQVRASAGLRDVRFHDLRHTCATRLVQAGMPLAEVGRILGHSDLSRLLMTFRYVGTDDTTLTRAAGLLDARAAMVAESIAPAGGVN